MFSRFFSDPSRSSPIQNNILASYDFKITFFDEAFVLSSFSRFVDNAEGQYFVEQFILDQCRATIEEEFVRAVETAFNGYVTVRIESMEYGSVLGTVTLVLVAGLSVYEFVSKYKDFYDSLILLRQQLRIFMERKLRGYLKGGNRTTKWDTEVRLTSLPAMVTFMHSSSNQPKLEPIYSVAFFWYLIIVNIILTTSLAALVYRAIVTVYFTTP